MFGNILATFYRSLQKDYSVLYHWGMKTPAQAETLLRSNISRRQTFEKTVKKPKAEFHSSGVQTKAHPEHLLCAWHSVCAWETETRSLPSRYAK